MIKGKIVWLTGIAALASAGAVAAKNWGDWISPVNLETLPGSSSAIHTPAVDGCASTSADGLTLLFTSNRTGDFDLYTATRPNDSVGFGTPTRLPPPINTPGAESCATFGPGQRIYFSSTRDDPAADIYVSEYRNGAWTEPENLGPNINTPGWLDEVPAFYEDGDDLVMLFSARQAGGAGDGNIYMSVNGGPKSLVAGGVNSSASDNRPSVTRDGLTIFFDSTRTGSLGSSDLYFATRSSTAQPFGPAQHLQSLSSPGFDARPYVSKDGSFMTFSSGRPGNESPAPDIWITSREKVTGNSGQ